MPEYKDTLSEMNFIYLCMRRGVYMLSVLCCVMLLNCCNHDKSVPAASEDTGMDLLYRLGDSTLTVHQVESRIPVGLDAVDSITLFNNIAKQWLYDLLLEQVATANIDNMEEIESQVAQYRRRLIVESYRRNMSRKNASNISTDSIRNYYRNHGSELRLDQPALQGVLIKLPSGSSKVETVRKWLHNPTKANIDKLEKHALDDALQYEYFLNNWQEWEVIREQIPYHFPEASSFVTSHKYFETEYAGSIYILAISDYKLPGEVMPYPIAAPIIQSILENISVSEADARLLNELRNRAINQGILTDYRQSSVSQARQKEKNSN